MVEKVWQPVVLALIGLVAIVVGLRIDPMSPECGSRPLNPGQICDIIGKSGPQRKTYDDLVAERRTWRTALPVGGGVALLGSGAWIALALHRPRGLQAPRERESGGGRSTEQQPQASEPGFQGSAPHFPTSAPRPQGSAPNFPTSAPRPQGSAPHLPTSAPHPQGRWAPQGGAALGSPTDAQPQTDAALRFTPAPGSGPRAQATPAPQSRWTPQGGASLGAPGQRGGAVQGGAVQGGAVQQPAWRQVEGATTISRRRASAPGAAHASSAPRPPSSQDTPPRRPTGAPRPPTVPGPPRS